MRMNDFGPAKAGSNRLPRNGVFFYSVVSLLKYFNENHEPNAGTTAS